MMVANGDGTYFSGEHDAWFILHNTKTNTYHPAFFQEMPLPGQYAEGADRTSFSFVRLRCYMSDDRPHTLEQANTQLDEDTYKLDTHGNVFRNPVIWDGARGMVLVVANWRANPRWRPEARRPRPDPSTLPVHAPVLPPPPKPKHVPDPNDDAAVRFSLLEID